MRGAGVTAARPVVGAVLAVGMLLAGVAGCGAPADPGPGVLVPGGPGEQARALAGAEAQERRMPVPVSPADVEFVERMVPHHRQALQMAALAPDRATDPQVRAMAARIGAVQGPEIAVLQAWLEGQEHFVGGHHDGQAGAHRMPGMATPAQLATLAAAAGPVFDRLFVELMTAHHRGALTMVDDLAGAGTDTRVGEIARDIAVTQTVEIDRMRTALG